MEYPWYFLLKSKIKKYFFYQNVSNAMFWCAIYNVLKNDKLRKKNFI